MWCAEREIAWPLHWLALVPGDFYAEIEDLPQHFPGLRFKGFHALSAHDESVWLGSMI